MAYPAVLPAGTFTLLGIRKTSLSLNYLAFQLTEDSSWDNFIAHFLSGEAAFGDYFDHVLDWWKHRNDDNVLFITYEDMKADIRVSIARIARFMGHELSKDEIEPIIEKSSLKHMKNNPMTNYEWLPKELINPELNPFVRKGIVGGWKEWFSAEQSAQFDALYAQKFESVGLKLNFN